MNKDNFQEVLDKVRKDAAEKAANEGPRRGTLKHAIQQALVQRIVSSKRAVRRDRGKGRDNVMQRSLLTLHRQIGTPDVLDTTSDRWLDNNG